MLSLIMDTSNQYLLVSLYEDGKCLEAKQELGSKRQSENAIPYLSEILKNQNKELLDIDEMIITRGPGSYTGERVAMTIAKTLSVVSSVKIKAISSLAAYAGMDDCISVIDARSKKVFACCYSGGKALCDEQLVEVSEFPHLIAKYPHMRVVGQSEVVGYPNEEVDLAQNIYELSKEAEVIENVDALVPRYLKDVEAKKICL